MIQEFDQEEAKKFLLAKDQKEKEEKENERKLLLQNIISILEKEFKGSTVEAYLIGSILQPYRFTARSDIDIVLKNYQKDRFDIWTQIETKIRRKIEIILFETCTFKDVVLKNGFKVV